MRFVFDIDYGFGAILFTLFLSCILTLVMIIEDTKRIYQIIMRSILAMSAILLTCNICVSMRMKHIPYDYQEDKEPYSVEYLVGLNDNSGVNGRTSYIYRGYVESNMYYNYMVDCGSYLKQNQLNAITNDIRVIVSSSETPRVEWRKKRKEVGPFFREEKYWIIYVPDGTISTDIRIDMQ